ALGLIGWKFVSGNLQPYVLSSQAVSSAAKIGNYFVIDASGFIDAYLSAKNKFVGFSFYVSGEGFDVAYTEGDDAVAVGMSILGQYSDRDLSFCGRADGDSSITHFTGTIDHYKYTWENPAIGLICCHFAAADITINQAELINYDLIPSDVGN
ncbi:hypothetical protein JXA32_09135, partial [Candidatus Sumerlaeota bacterium]|nr:hypothetical protein [Candidatus Sumerlaeota bacterium]